MPEEYLDIVDKNGNPTGEKELRSVVHKKGLWHWVVVISFYRLNKNGIEILTHLRSKYKDQHPNRWTARFGGHLISGQTVEDAVLKEVQEETGIKIEPNDLLKGKIGKYNGGKNKEFISTFYYNFSGNEKELTFDDGEVQEVKWMRKNDIVKSMQNEPEIWTGKAGWLLEIIKYLKSML